MYIEIENIKRNVWDNLCITAKKALRTTHFLCDFTATSNDGKKGGFYCFQLSQFGLCGSLIFFFMKLCKI